MYMQRVLSKDSLTLPYTGLVYKMDHRKNEDF